MSHVDVAESSADLETEDSIQADNEIGFVANDESETAVGETTPSEVDLSLEGNEQNGVSSEMDAEGSTEAEVSDDAEAEPTEAEPTEAEPTEAEPTEAESREEPAKTSGFRGLGLKQAVVDAVESAGYTVPTPIQAQTIPLLAQGNDVLGQAQTGTGKTAAFALPTLSRINTSSKKTQVLVLAPTRELAIQVAESFEKYSKQMRGVRVAAIYGGQDYQIQFRQLERGVQVVVGTPGRVMDHLRRGSLNLDDLQCIVLDEADEMLRMGFAEDVDWVLTQTPDERQVALFSATMPPEIRRIAQTHLTNPSEITIHQKTKTADTVHQRFVVAAPYQKEAILARILEGEATDGVLVFVKMKSTTEPLAEFLADKGLKTAALHGDVAQKQRERIVDNLRSGRVDVIVATDVAARGLDVQRISHVINYDLPFDSEAYIHRIGRTGRAGRSGQAILFVHPRERRHLKRLEQATRQTIEPMVLPSNRDINKQRVARFHEQITDALSHRNLESYQSVVEQYQRENEVPIEMIAAAMAVIASGETSLFVKDSIKQADFADNRRNGKDRSYGEKRSKFRKNSENRKPQQTNFQSNGKMKTYRIEVGHNHQVRPGNIVGAIANEAGVGTDAIGKIKIFDRFSTVDLADGFPNELLDRLKNVSVSGRKLLIRPDTHKFEDRGKSPKRFDKKSKRKPRE